MKNTHTIYKRGYATSLVILGVVILIIVIVGGSYYISKKNNSKQPSTLSSNTTGTSTQINVQSQVTSTSTSTQSNSSSTQNLKHYSNPTIGIAFSYPQDFFLKSEGYSKTTSDWSASFTSDRGTVDLLVGRNVKTISETKLQSRTLSIGGKDISYYITRRDACDAAVAQTNLDADYSIRVTFQSCGNAFGSLIKDQTDALALLKSVTFSSENSRLYIDPQLGFAFRYPSTLPKPIAKTTSSLTTLSFGDELTISTGLRYSSITKKNQTAQELATAESVNSSLETTTLSGVPAYKVEQTPTGSAKERTIYATNKTNTDVLVIKQKGIDATTFDLVTSTFTFIK